LKDVEGHTTPTYTCRERIPPQRFDSYVDLMSNIMDFNPCYFEEAVVHEVWKDAMLEEYQSMENDIWDIVLRLKGKLVVTSNWIYKIKHTADDNIEKYKEMFV
jgi:hypothetical protein